MGEPEESWRCLQLHTPHELNPSGIIPGGGIRNVFSTRKLLQSACGSFGRLNIGVPVCFHSFLCSALCSMAAKGSQGFNMKVLFVVWVPRVTSKGEWRQKDILEATETLDEISSFLPCAQSQGTRKIWVLAVFLVPICCWSYFVTVVSQYLIFTDLYVYFFLCFVKVFLPTAEKLQIQCYRVMCWLCFLIYRRTFIYPFFTRGRPFPLQLLFFGTLFCIYNGFLQGYYLIYCAEYPNDWCTDIRFTSGNYSCRIPKM